MYLITKRFLSGVLKGLTVVDESPVAFTVGQEYKGILTSSVYVVENCKEEVVNYGV